MSSKIDPWEHSLSIWKTKSQYFTWLRGNIRRIWEDNPLRKSWKKASLRPVTLEEKSLKRFHPSTKNVGMCYICEKWMAGSKLECDHMVGESSCFDFETAEKFLWHCCADNPENWGLVCSPCHKIKTYAERYGISFELAKATKEVIGLEKMDVVEQVLEGFGIIPKSNAKLRREQLIELFMEGNDVADT